MSLRVTPQLTLTARLPHDQELPARADYRSTRRGLDLSARYDFPIGLRVRANGRKTCIGARAARSSGGRSVRSTR